MKLLFAVFAIFFCCNGFSQQDRYEFNHIIEYEFTRNEGEPSDKIYILTNSATNSYSAYLHSRDSRHFYIHFKDESGVGGYSVIAKDQFFMAENIIIRHEDVKRFEPLDDKQIDRYELFTKPDTIINNVAHKQYGMRYKRKSEAREFNKGEATYIVENGTEFHKPLILFSSSFDTHVTSPIFPNGIAKEIFTRNRKPGTKIFQYKLSQHKAVKKFIELQKP